MRFRPPLLSIPLLLLCAGLAAGQQLPPISPPPMGPPVPQGTGGCSVEAPTCAQVAPEIIANALGPSPLQENLRYLTDVIGGRMTGSLAAARAVAWAVAAFRKAGVDDVHTEKFSVAARWSEGRTRLVVLQPPAAAGFPVRLVSTGWSPPTPPGGIEAAVVDVGTGSEADFARVGPAARGAILLVHTKELKTLEDLFAEYQNGPGIVHRALESGARAILWMSTRPYLLLYRHLLTLTGNLAPLPQAIVAREDAERMARLLAAGTSLRVRLLMPNRVAGPFTSENVVAEIRGREKPDEFVVLAAHLDSWDLGTGALDNGCNAALVIDATRAIHLTGVRPRRSVRFILFTGEEQGMLGSWAYARAHRRELDRADAVIVFDDGDGRVTGYMLSGRYDIEARLRQALAPAAQFHPGEDTFDAELGTDNFDFLLEGVPTLVANQQEDDYLMNYHAASDTFDKVDFAQLKRNVALAALTAYGIADLPERLGKRQTRAEILALMRETGLDKQMKQMGIWQLWEEGKRGRQIESVARAAR
jgi:carboxypeptidase Q